MKKIIKKLILIIVICFALVSFLGFRSQNLVKADNTEVIGKVDGVDYTSVDELFNAIKNKLNTSNEVKFDLLKTINVSNNNYLSIYTGKVLTIDLHGHGINFDSNSSSRTIYVGSFFVIGGTLNIVSSEKTIHYGNIENRSMYPYFREVASSSENYTYSFEGGYLSNFVVEKEASLIYSINNVNISDVTFVGFADTNDSSNVNYGRIITGNSTSNINLTNCRFEYNQSSKGEFIYINNSTNLTMTNCNINNNFVYNEFTYSNEVRAFITSSNTSGVVRLTKSTFNFNNMGSGISYGTNIYNAHGTVIYNTGSATYYIDECNFEHNSCNVGGVLYNTGNNELFITKSHFNDNKARVGGVIYHNGTSTYHFSDCEIKGNTVIDESLGITTENYGGVIYNESSMTLYLENTIISENSAYQGGFVYSSAQLIIYGDSNYEYNENATSSDESRMTGTIIKNNTATDTGCAFYLCKGYNITFIQSLNIYNNYSDYGTAIVAFNTYKLTLSGVNIVGNSCVNNGNCSAFSSSYCYELTLADIIVVKNQQRSGNAMSIEYDSDAKNTLTGVCIIRGNINTQGSNIGDLRIYSSSSDQGFYGVLDSSSYVRVYISRAVGQKFYLTRDTAYHNINCYQSSYTSVSIYYDSICRDGSGRIIAYGKDDGNIQYVQYNEGLTNVGITEFDGFDYDVYRGVFSYEENGNENAGTYYYSDGFFAYDSHIYCSSLATLSLVVSMAGKSANSDDGIHVQTNHWYNLMKDIGFSNLYVNEDGTRKATKDTTGLMMASKEIAIYDDTFYQVVAINIRNDNTSELANAFNVGSVGEHAGYAQKVNSIINQINEYIKNASLELSLVEGRVKFWVTGFGYAGNLASLVSKKLIEMYQIDGNQIYGYTFGTSKIGSLVNESSKASYISIYNINLTNDFYTNLIPSSWNMKRYGTEKIIDNLDSSVYNKFINNLKAINIDNFYNYNVTLGNFNYNSNTKYLSDLFGYSYGNRSVTINEFASKFGETYSSYLNLNRDSYMGGNVTINNVQYPSLQTALSNLVNKYGSLSYEEKEMFIKKLFNLLNELDTDERTVANTYFGNWSAQTDENKLAFIEMLWNAGKRKDVNGVSLLSYFTETEQTEFKSSFVTLIHYLMVYCDADAVVTGNDAFSGYNTSTTYPMFATFVKMFKLLNACHSEEIYFAWLRAYDSNYDSSDAMDTKVIKVLTQGVTTESASLYQGDNKVYKSGSSYDSFKTYTITSDTEGMIFYSLSASNEYVTITPEYNLYCFPFVLNSLYGDTSTVYTISIYTYYHGAKSEVNTYQITVNGLPMSGYNAYDSTVIYDGLPHFIEESITGEALKADILYYCNGEQVDKNSFIDVTNRTITYRVLLEGYAKVEGSAQLAINPAVIVEPIVNKTQYIYNGMMQTLLKNDDHYTVENAMQKEVGQYTVIVKLENTNYIWKKHGNDDLVFNYEIIKATFDLSQVKWNYTGNVSYNGTEINVGFDESILPLGLTLKNYDGIAKATNVGNYQVKAIFEYDANSYYEPVMELEWVISPALMDVNWSENNYTYNGSVQNIEASYMDVFGTKQILNVIIDKEFKDAGTYIASITCSDSNYKILDNDKTNVYLMKYASLLDATIEVEELKYNGKEQIVTIKSVKVGNLDATYIIKEGTNKVTNVNKAGNKIVLIGTGNFSDERVYTYYLEPYQVDINWCDNDFTFNGEVQRITATYQDINGETQNFVIVSASPFKNVGSYIASASFDEETYNYVINGETSKEYLMKCNKLTKPVNENKVFDYNGKIITYIPTNFDSKLMDIIGNKQSQINENGYNCIISLVDPANSCWSDDTTEDISVTFYIQKVKLTKPLENDVRFEYSGEKIIYLPKNFDQETMTITNNEQTKINESGYQVIVGILDKNTYCWEDGTQDDIEFKFAIYPKAEEKVSLEILKQGYDISGLLDNAISGKVLTIETELGTFTFNSSAVIDLQYKDVVLKATLEEQGDNTRINVSINGSSEIKTINGKVTVSIDYKKKDIENTTMKFYEINDDGSKTEKTASFKNDKINFVVDHSSTYEIAYEQVNNNTDENTGCGCNKGIDCISSLLILPIILVPFGFRIIRRKEDE